MPTQTKPCQTCATPFKIASEDEAFYKRMKVPHPTSCPTCRNNTRMRWRNFNSLHNRTSDLSGKPIISMFPKESPLTVYSSEEWHGDSWNALDYGQDIDWNKPFFEQFHNLHSRVPHASLLHYQCENSNYCNLAFNSKACYMVFGCVENEDCLYGHIVWRSTDCTDGLYLYECELCYESTDCISCYNCDYCRECRNSNDLKHCYDCVGCHFCFGCTGLRQKEYCIYNEQFTKEEYKSRLASNKLTGNLEDRLNQLTLETIHPHYYGYQNEDVSGNHIYYSKNTHHSFDAKRCEDCKFLFTAQRFNDVYDASFCSGDCEVSYNCLSIGNCQHLICSQRCHDSSNLQYCDECTSCHDCFGCIGLKHKRHCILNKQYDRATYENLLPRLIAHMTKTDEYGKFFPEEICPFTYEESILSSYQQ